MFTYIYIHTSYVPLSHGTTMSGSWLWGAELENGVAVGCCERRKKRDLGDVQRLVSTQNYSTNISLKIHPKFQVAEENMFNSARYGVQKAIDHIAPCCDLTQSSLLFTTKWMVYDWIHTSLSWKNIKSKWNRIIYIKRIYLYICYYIHIYMWYIYICDIYICDIYISIVMYDWSIYYIIPISPPPMRHSLTRRSCLEPSQQGKWKAVAWAQRTGAQRGSRGHVDICIVIPVYPLVNHK